MNGICTCIGAIPKYPERKFIVNSFEFPKDLSLEIFSVETIIFQLNGIQMRAIRRTQDSNSTYMVTSSSNINSSSNTITSRQISGREYMSYYQRKESILQKNMIYFLYEGKYYALNEYKTNPSLFILEVEAPENENIESLIPSFIKIGKEVTNNSNYTSEYLAKE